MKKTCLLFVFFLTMGATLYAQLKFSGEFRPRAEYRHGFRTPSDSAMDPAFFVDQRTRLNVDYQHTGYKFRLSLQDIRTWGSVPQLNRIDGFTAVHEAWGEIIFSPNISLRAGRQEISLDDHRIMGNVGWAQQARSHDAAVFKYEKGKMKLHLGGAYNQNGPRASGTNYTVPNYKTLQYLWYHRSLNDAWKLSLLALSNGLQVNTQDALGNPTHHDNYSLTSGGRLTCKKNALNAGLNAYYQLGSTNDFPARSISGYLVGLDIAYKVREKFVATVGTEWISGHDQTNTSTDYAKTQRAFFPLYGTNHKFNGFMDYFYVGNHAGSVGLRDFYVKGKWGDKSKYLGLDLHAFLSGASILDTKALAELNEVRAMGNFMGVEADLSFGFPLSPGVMLKGGYSQAFVSESLAVLKGVTDAQGVGRTAPISNWAYVMVIVKPTFWVTQVK